MTEPRTLYTTRISNGSRAAYPGSRLELLAEALDTLKATAPEAYRAYQHIHGSIDEALFGELKPVELINWLVNRDP